MQYHTIIKAILNYVAGEDSPQLNSQERMMIQHVLYLSNELGVYVGDFVWNITNRGVESNSVSSIIEDCKGKDKDNNDGIELKESIINKLNPLRELVAEYKTYKLTKEEWLFALATVHYAYSNKAAKNTEVIVKVLTRKGFKIYPTEVLNALRELENHKLIGIKKRNKRVSK